MNTDELAKQIRPVGLQLLQIDDSHLDPVVVVCKSLICIIMGLCEQIPEHQRRQAAQEIAVALAPVFERVEADGD